MRLTRIIRERSIEGGSRALAARDQELTDLKPESFAELHRTQHGTDPAEALDKAFNELLIAAHCDDGEAVDAYSRHSRQQSRQPAGDFALDFANGPLGDAGIFAITGPTGAGSPIADAMSLALFDAIPRLAGAPASGQLSDDEFSPRDPRAILRHGAGEGHAELDFVARDGRSYRSRWSVRRARGRADGRLQQASIDLECLDTGERLGGRKRETLAEIERLIGLNAEQFGRAVVLAQGEFEAFIKASGRARPAPRKADRGSHLHRAR